MSLRMRGRRLKSLSVIFIQLETGKAGSVVGVKSKGLDTLGAHGANEVDVLT